MGRYVIRRLLQFVPTLIGAFFLLHYIVVLGVQLRGNPARAFFGDKRPTEAMLEAVKRLYNTDDPCLTQTLNPCVGLFFERVQTLAQGDLGVDYNQRPVIDTFVNAVPITLQLTLIAIVVQIVIGLIAGMLAGVRGGGISDYIVKVVTVLIIAVPVFVLGKLVQSSITPAARYLNENGYSEAVRGVVTVTWRSDAPFMSLLIPGIVLGALGLATTARLTRTSLMENLRADYVRTAVAKGMPRRRVIGVHTLRNSLIPVVTDLGYSVGVLMGGAVVTETIFNIPGVGGEIIRAAQRNEAPILISMVTMLVLVYLVVNLIVDVLYAVLDPRIRYD
ncbi:MAG: ABC transporter permease [Micromonosporaceae bacterium]